MELDKLIDDLNTYAVIVEYHNGSFADTLRKAAEVIKLQRECICEESNEKWRRGIDSLIWEAKEEIDNGRV